MLARYRLLRKLSAYASASIAIHGTTKADAAIVHTPLASEGIEIGPEFAIDLDADGEADFWLRDMTQTSRDGCGIVVTTDDGGTYTTCTFDFSHFRRYGLHATGADENRILRDPDYQHRIGIGLGKADRFAPGELISTLGPVFGTDARAFVEGYVLCHTSRDVCGRVPGPSERFFLGLYFDIPDSGRSAAWVDVAWIDDLTSPRVYGFAYETTPGLSIAAGDIGEHVNPPGDGNGDGLVDLEDLNLVRDNFGATGVDVPGDTNDDGTVDLGDLNEVRNNFGAGGTNPVPEPSSLALLALGAVGIVARRRMVRR